jgi:hypothetical protein
LPPLYLFAIENLGRLDISVVDPHHFDADMNSTYDPDAGPDADPDYSVLFDTDPDQTFPPDADPDPLRKC